jgi:hypothetical protein
MRSNRIEPVVMSAGELESEWAGAPGRLIRDRYFLLSTSQIIRLFYRMGLLLLAPAGGRL